MKIASILKIKDKVDFTVTQLVTMINCVAPSPLFICFWHGWQFLLIINEDRVNFKNKVQNQIDHHQISLHDNFYSYMTSPYMLLRMLTYCHFSLIINEDRVNFKNKARIWIPRRVSDLSTNFYLSVTFPSH